MRPSLDKELISQYVGPSSFQKGLRYVANGAVKLGRIKTNVLTAFCQGHEFDPYRVEVIFNEKGIEQSYCSCPVGAGGKCKHVAALLLAWASHPEDFSEWQQLAENLKKYDPQTLLELIDLLEEKAEGAADVIHAFQLNMQTLKSPSLAKYLKRVEEAFQVSRVPWYHSDEAQVTEIAFSLGKIRSDAADMIEKRHFNEGIRIFQVLIQHILSYLEEHRDPWEALGEEIKECVHTLGRALELLPKQDEMRQKVLQLLFRIIEEQFYRASKIGAEEAREVMLRHLNSEEKERVIAWVKALQVSKREEEEELFWIKDFLIDLEKDQLEPEVYLDYYRQTNQIIKLVNSLLELNRVQEADMVAHQPQFLSQVLPLADLFVQHHQESIAEYLVLESVKAHPSIELYNWLKNFYLKQNQKDKALFQVLQILRLVPQFSYYQEAQELATELGKWKNVRSEILELLNNLHYFPLLLEIYLDEKNLEEAIDIYQHISAKVPEAFKESHWFWLILQLAASTRYKHPQIAIQIYQEIIKNLIEERNRESYQRATDYLKMIKDIYKETQQSKEWTAYLKNFMQTYSRFKALQDEIRRASIIP